MPVLIFYRLICVGLDRHATQDFNLFSGERSTQRRHVGLVVNIINVRGPVEKIGERTAHCAVCKLTATKHQSSSANNSGCGSAKTGQVM